MSQGTQNFRATRLRYTPNYAKPLFGRHFNPECDHCALTIFGTERRQFVRFCAKSPTEIPTAGFPARAIARRDGAGQSEKHSGGAK